MEKDQCGWFTLLDEPRVQLDPLAGFGLSLSVCGEWLTLEDITKLTATLVAYLNGEFDEYTTSTTT